MAPVVPASTRSESNPQHASHGDGGSTAAAVNASERGSGARAIRPRLRHHRQPDVIVRFSRGG